MLGSGRQGNGRDAKTAAPEERRGGPAVRAGAEMRKLLEVFFRLPRAERSLEVTAAWSRAVGPRIAQVARPVRIVDRKLLVQVTSPTWRNELLLRAREIVAKLRRELGDTVEALDVRVGVNPDVRAADPTADPSAREPMPGLTAIARRLESPELRAMAEALAEGRSPEPDARTRRGKGRARPRSRQGGKGDTR